jgi:hypothetical protein
MHESRRGAAKFEGCHPLGYVSPGREESGRFQNIALSAKSVHHNLANIVDGRQEREIWATRKWPAEAIDRSTSDWREIVLADCVGYKPLNPLDIVDILTRPLDIVHFCRLGSKWDAFQAAENAVGTVETFTARTRARE